jgi:peptidoglycan/LPS O-acetylase OafA/YrhL
MWFINRLLECYLSFPLLWWIAHKTGQAGLLLTYLLCLLGGGIWVVYSQVTLPDYYFLLVLCLSHFILGILAAKFTEQPKRSLYVVISIIIFIILLECLHQSIWQTPLAYTWISLLWLNFIAVLFVVILRTYLLQVIFLPKTLSILMQKMGDISYSFYLYHFLVLHFFMIHREYLSIYNSLNFISLFMISTITAVFFQWLLTMITHGVLYIRQGISYNQG